ncbi:aminopeptidase N [Desulfuromonas thiophila]|uniref:Aminopeptidase N n=1 Tax=Desulfuromonas thiophila TaxID=57664 RepID=A0A1G6XLR2_9BACT|nr:aminopeptidase N [Desulfuromonas thiophila]SDD78982.1 aminopeptidase N [Desulfuromonas thiophila]
MTEVAGSSTAARQQAEPVVVRRLDYRPPDWLVDEVELCFWLDPRATRVQGRLRLRRADAGGTAPLRLHGGDQPLVRLCCDGAELASHAWQRDSDGLTLFGLPAACTLEIETELDPQANRALEGLYLSAGIFCTQCEAEGFRRILFFPDRPDVLARYTTTLIADERLPVLLANGNLVASGPLADGRHFARWHDPFPKPSYLFALVAGELVCRERPYRTLSGRSVQLQIYVEPRNAALCDHALASLERAMRWDEQRFGLEYDLERYMVVAVDDFNMGAMENKGLNVFNSKYVLACPATATDDDYLDIEGVIAHEYFHNWTGNRITCRDWFQLSLKEGLTVFRDQEFSADMHSAAIKRIEEVRLLQTQQFAEDAGPTAHPVRPDSYVEINNFYTMTVYHKGAELVRLLQTLLGWEDFVRGMRLYVERHDGQAVTTDDFVAAVLDANPQAGIDRELFSRWYSQAGTPLLRLSWQQDAAAGQWRLHCRQSCPPTPGQEHKQPVLIPLRLALLDASGRPCGLRLAGETEAGAPERVLRLTAAEQEFTFVDLPGEVTPSLLRGFSAPVRLEAPLTREQQAFLMAHDSDAFNRWQAAQALLLQALLAGLKAPEGGAGELADSLLLEAFHHSLTDQTADPALLALALTLPTEGYIADQLPGAVDPARVHQVREKLRGQLATRLNDALLICYRQQQDAGPYVFSGPALARRRLKNLCLTYLARSPAEEARDLLWQQARHSDNMTDTAAAMALLAETPDVAVDELLQTFYQRWRHQPLVIDKWLAWQARSQRPDCLARLCRLLEDPAFSLTNPNRVRALIGTFCQANPYHFHAADGSGYRFLEQQLCAIDGFNPQVAARLVLPLLRWPRFEPGRRVLMLAVLQRLAARQPLSRDLYEMVQRALAQEAVD